VGSNPPLSASLVFDENGILMWFFIRGACAIFAGTGCGVIIGARILLDKQFQAKLTLVL